MNITHEDHLLPFILIDEAPQPLDDDASILEDVADQVEALDLLVQMSLAQDAVVASAQPQQSL